MVPVVGRARKLQRRLLGFGLLHPFAVAVGFVTESCAVVAVDTHLAVAMEGVERAARSVHGDRMVVDAEAVALGVAVGKEPALQHLVGRQADAGNDGGGIEGRLLDIGEIVLRIAVELQHADVDERKVPVRPDLGQIERIVGQLGGLGFGHDLDLHVPLREFARFDAVEQVALVAFAILGDDRFGLGVGEAFDALRRLEVELDPGPLARGVEQTEGMAAVAVHVAV